MRLLFLISVLALAGCPDRTISKVVPQEGRVAYNNAPVTPNHDLDILFLIDDSPSMQDKQDNLKANFPSFINVLNTIQGGLPNIHLGVATSDLGSKGADDAQPGAAISGCSGNGKAGNLQTSGSTLLNPGSVFISDTKNASSAGRQTNYTGTLADAFSSIANVGVAGCGFEQHLEAIKRALDNNPVNSGFLRPDAYLGVIILGDEDDCSMAHSTLIGNDPTLGLLQSFRCTRYGVTCDQGGQDPNAMNQVGPKGSCHSNESKTYLTDVQRYVDFLKGLKPDDPKKLIVADIGGPPTPVETELRPPPGGGSPIPALAHSCTYTDVHSMIEVADPTVRVTQFLHGFPDRNTFSTICQQDLSGALIQIAKLVGISFGSECIDGNLVVPYDCSVSEVTNYGKPNQGESVLPECDNPQTPASSTNKPCWAIEPDPDCSTPTMLAIKVERNVAPPKDDHVISYCVTQ